MTPDEDSPAYIEPTDEIKRLFPAWRPPRMGTSNPERMSNPVWDWLVRTRITAFEANEKLGGPDVFENGPGWCFSRFGQSETVLPDGRIVRIAGEHEDHYDPDFYIYNDVVIEHPGGKIDIYGYPTDEFPPTDFHSATRREGKIWMVGNLGYPEQRRPGFTPIYTLALDTFQIHRQEATGENPGWIHRHIAEMRDERIIIRGGEIQPEGKETTLIENIDEWALDLRTLNWERLTRHLWSQWEFWPREKRINGLWELRSAGMWKAIGGGVDPAKFLPEGVEGLADILNESRSKAEARLREVNLDDLYTPSVPHTAVEKDPGNYEEHNVWRIIVNGVTVRFVEETGPIRMIVEGQLPTELVNQLAEDLRVKLEKIEGTPYLTKNVSA